MTTGNKGTVDLVVKPEGSGAIVGIPLSSTGEDGKATSYVVRNEIGETLLSVDAETQTTTVRGALLMPVHLDDAARDAAIGSPVAGMMVFVASPGVVQVYDGSGWVQLATV